MARYIPQAGRKPHIFLSYSSKEKNITTQLADDLMACEVDTWLDDWEIETGDSIFKSINEGLESSRYVGLVISNDFIKSKWASEEVQAAFDKQVSSGEKVILPLIFENITLPLLLKSKAYLSFTDNYYHSLTKLAAIAHHIDSRTIRYAIDKKNPSNLAEALDTLYFCGFNPHLIVPKNVFDELSKIPGVEVDDDRLGFPDLMYMLGHDQLSSIAKSYLQKIWQGDRPKVQ